MLATAHVVPFAAFAAAASLLAQTGPPPIPAELRARFGFEGPLVVKVGDGLGNLQIADVDGDGRVEAVAVDARRARLVAVRVRDRATTELQPIPTNGQIGGYAFTDVHGDGKPDLLLVDARGRLTVRQPGAQGGDAPLDLGLGRGVVLLPGDLDGDGKNDVVAIAKGNMRCVTSLATTPKLSPLEPNEEGAYSFHLTDLDGDRRVDMVAVAPGPNMNLRLRHGLGDGAFGAWRIFSIDGLHDVFPARTAEGKAALGTIAGATRAVALQELRTGEGQQALHWWALGESTGGKAMPWALGDIDRDGDDDLVIARADRAQLAIHEWTGETFAPRAVPTLAGVTSVGIGDVDRDGTGDVVLVSPEEDTVAWISGQGPLDRFPEPLAAQDKPIAAAIDPNGGVLVLTRTDKRDAALLRCTPGGAAEKLADLGRVPGDPQRLFVADLGDAAGLEVAFIVPGEGLRTLSLGAGGKVEKVEKQGGKPTDTAGFTKKLDDGAIALTRAGDQAALLAVRERFVRTFRIDDKGQVRVLAQDNGPDGMTELALAADLGDGARCYLDKKANKLARVDGKGLVTTVDVPAFDFGYLVGHRGAALLLSARGVLRVPFAPGAVLRAVTTHEPPLVRTAYWTGRAGDFDHDGISDLVVVDRHLPGVQILAGGAGGLQRALAVPVFETPPSEDPDNEPRELDVGDLDGDGRTDFVLIAHDRILIYLQEP